MYEINQHTASQKSLRHSTSSNKDQYFENATVRKPAPIPLIRTKIQSSSPSEITSRLLVRNYKYMSRVNASGLETGNLISKLNQSVNLKLITRFQFDPYLCEFSFLKVLRCLLKKLKTIRNLLLTLRRSEYLNETDILCPILSRLLRMRKLQVELPCSLNLDDQGIINLLKTIGKCYSLNSLSTSIVNLKNLTEKSREVMMNFRVKLMYLQEIEHLAFRKGGVIRSEGTPAIKIKKVRYPKLKIIQASVGVKKSWTTSDPGLGDGMLPSLVKAGLKLNVESFSLKFQGNSLGSKSIIAVLKLASLLKKLKSLRIEFLNCKTYDFDMINFAITLTKIPHIQHLTFKVIQYPNLPRDCILQFAKIIASISTLQVFDIYFRRLDFQEEVIQELIQNISHFKDVECSSFKQSLYIFRRNNLS